MRSWTRSIRHFYFWRKHILNPAHQSWRPFPNRNSVRRSTFKRNRLMRPPLSAWRSYVRTYHWLNSCIIRISCIKRTCTSCCYRASRNSISHYFCRKFLIFSNYFRIWTCIFCFRMKSNKHILSISISS